MKIITLNNIEWIESPNFYPGRTEKVRAIVIHWWGDPAQKPTMDGVINYFKKPSSEVSAHFVVSGDRVVQMVNMGNTAWHARQANPFTVGIEVDPRVPGNTYETVGALVKFIRSYYGNIGIKRHSGYVATACPGSLDLNRIDQIAYGTYKAPAPAPTPPPATTVSAKDKSQDEAIAQVNTRLAAIDKIIAAIDTFLTSIFKNYKK